METTCIRFDAPRSSNQPAQAGLIKRSLEKILIAILTSIIPKANPDFDDQINEVECWLVECANETEVPEREIGLSKEGKVLCKMPYNDNYGYWTDNSFLLKDFRKTFVVAEISQADFDRSWASFTVREDPIKAIK